MKSLSLYDNVADKRDKAVNKQSKADDKNKQEYETNKQNFRFRLNDAPFKENEAKYKDQTKYSKNYGDFYASSDMDKMEAATIKRLKTFKDTRESLFKAMNDGVLQETLSGYDADTQKQSLVMLAS